MHIKKLYIKDFGIYSNASIDNISPGIVVLGGKNRAGKSTLMKFLRYFPYGFSKSLDIPDCRIEYEGEVQMLEGNEEYNIRVKGFSDPLITAYSSKKSYKKNLYGKIDSLTYREIFTISLDELQKVDKKNEKIQSLLLGAGLKEIIKIPKLIAEMKKEGGKIGGKNGNPKIKLFKQDYISISEGLNIKEKALHQLDEFKEFKDRLKAVEQKIHTVENVKDSIEDKIFILDILKNNYEIYRELNNIDVNLGSEEHRYVYENFIHKHLSLEVLNNIKDEYVKIQSEYNRLKINFSQNLQDSGKIEEDFDLYGDKLKEMELSISGLKEKIKNYNFSFNEYRNSKREINRDIIDINKHWIDNFAYILKVDTEEIHFGHLCENIDELKRCKDKIELLNSRIEELSNRKKLITEENSKPAFVIINNYFVICALISLFFIFLGLFIYSFNKILGIIASLIGGALCHSIFNSIYFNSKKNREKSIDGDRKNIHQELEKNKELLKKINVRKNELSHILDEYKDKLGIEDKNIPLDSIKDYFRIIRDIKKRVIDLGYTLENIKKLKEEIFLKLNNMLNIIFIFEGDLKDSIKLSRESVGSHIISSSEYIFESVKKLNNIRNNYTDFKNIKIMKSAMEEDILKKFQLDISEKNSTDFLNEINKNIENFNIYYDYKINLERYENLKRQLIHSLKLEKVKKILLKSLKNTDGSDIFAAFKKYIENYISREEIDREISDYNQKFKNEMLKLENLKDERLNIKEFMKKLYSSEDIYKAQKKIDSGRRALKVKAEEYAIYNAAAFILEKVQKTFIDNAKDTILGSASDILSNITQGEIVSVLPPDDLTEYDFKTCNEDGKLNETTDILSRGTKEQLFLSVRLSRIKEIKENLPVIIDDSLVNFDNNHLKNVIGVLKKLSEENQIFILTCHSELVKLIYEEDRNAQFFKIDQGSFSEVEGNVLSDYLG
ncbi:AAA domain-containing protein [Clostridium pasteurianum DSM 525 = ATCC 6013]|uniref:AAA domain-containing protein n=1 Tax=Clostridium pasteurianum DSM 525 = ATCC 6013 TaxID=1262449 RepID=A0A0H3J6M7_CLOPA|nr:AAA family ATPase [Clostridium pasteurianum]AJA47578.1 AAA domain-containing protein [Clostridium pasteurianum DSM 525 = ATCC 6013]AJA51566.1 AAA domain-containing protein [Clostridium pasteurianum DSM 525 = ATCC 6013]AOZ74893.1 hypothetical protein AQ983_07265 [Clostridium pasteurianum DSM 525 = ATCC 6013]AOZ78688.1 hypothetical protein AQ984_07255 [Clostridium pasteurianum]ELP58081.1 hypothetical protein F502_16580 [Clostridium pasteurianum DSM 525 = ATCC 6013]